jgi:HAD superfamily hydrolase (TIGR01509 family)
MSATDFAKPQADRFMDLVIFDCDGVLVDSELISNGLLAEMMTELGHPMTAEAAIRTFAGRSLTDVLALAASILGREVPDELGQAYGRRLLDRLARDLKPVDGVKAAVAALPNRRCVASSSSFERIRLSLDVTGLTPLFDGHIFSATQVAHGKPAPDLYVLAARTMGAVPDRCVVVEDSPLGVTAAVAAGMAAIGFIGAGHTPPDLAQQLAGAGARCVISSMRELPGAIAMLAGDGRPPVVE